MDDDDDEQQVLTRDASYLIRYFLLRGVRAEMRCSAFPNYQARGEGEDAR